MKMPTIGLAATAAAMTRSGVWGIVWADAYTQVKNTSNRLRVIDEGLLGALIRVTVLDSLR